MENFQYDIFPSWLQCALISPTWSLNSTPTVLNSSFIDGIITFESGILATLLPVGLDIITRIADRYDADFMAKKAASKLEFRAFPYMLIVSIFFTVFFHIAFDTNNYFYCFLSRFIIISFLINVIMTWRTVKLIWKYGMSKSDLLFEEYLNDAKKCLL